MSRTDWGTEALPGGEGQGRHASGHGASVDPLAGASQTKWSPEETSEAKGPKLPVGREHLSFLLGLV